jgi:hypothetical protein
VTGIRKCSGDKINLYRDTLMAKKKDESVTVKMNKSNKKLQGELLKFEKRIKRMAKKEKDNHSMIWINGYVSGAHAVLSQIEGY